MSQPTTPTANSQNPPYRPSYLAVAITVTTTAASLLLLIETQLNLPAGLKLASQWREVQIQVDPETSPGTIVRLGLSNLGTMVNSVVQKGISMQGGSDTYRGVMNAVDLAMMFIQSVSVNAVVNVQLYAV